VTVNAVHRSRVVSWEGTVGIRGGGIPADSMFVDWGSVSFLWYVFKFNRRFCLFGISRRVGGWD
jgi:hypothetical protein